MAWIDKLLKLAGKENFKLDPEISNGYIFHQCWQYGWMLIRGFFFTRGNNRIGKRFLKGRHVKIIEGKKLTAGANCRFSDGVYIDALSKSGVILGDHVVLGRNTRIECTGSLQHVGIGIKIGNDTSFGSDCYFGAAGGIEVGSNVVAGQYIRFHSENHNYDDLDVLIKDQGVSHKGIRVGSNCWIGAGAVFIDGAELCDPEFGTLKDRLEYRLDNNFVGGFQPLIRAHSGPFSGELTRQQCLNEYYEWCKDLASAGYLDVLSIGSSQLSQSNFGENWDGKPNGGGVPVNREQEYRNIWEAANPMLVRTYSGTKNVAAMADVYERTINIAWHALSLWWFDELDGRGPNTLYDNLKEHIETMRLVAAMGKPVETNVPHHFAFRGCDDVTYIVTGILAARMAKKCGVKNFVLQNMLNTPRSTWGVQDLAKSRAMLHIAKELEDDNFRIILQSRAGLDYFKPDLEAAKIQLASVTAMMDDIDPDNDHSPDIIHVVSYCEALYLATPDIINDSIKITRTALKEYRRLKKLGLTPDVKTDDIAERTEILETSARKILAAMEETIPDLYSPEGLYIAFVAGWLPVPELWSDSDEFIHAKCWETKMQNGGTHLVDHELLVPLETRINKCIAHNADAEYILKSKYKVLTRV